MESDWGERTEAQSLECCSGQQSAALKGRSNVLAAGWAKSQRWNMATWKKNTKLPFKAANPFFTSSQKPRSLPLNSTAKSDRSCFLSWEDGTQTEGAVEKEGWLQRVRVTFQVGEVNRPVLVLLWQVEKRKEFHPCWHRASPVLNCNVGESRVWNEATCDLHQSNGL